tara:strand:+ start:9252 stop:9776 length:525 start_codon:yes stop_codon:yes gene_type:complete
MKALDPFVINFASLKKGKQSLTILLDNKFFANFDFFDFDQVQLKTNIEIEKQENIFNFFLVISGCVDVLCDLSMETFKLPVSSNFNFSVKFGDATKNINDELLVFPHGTKDFNISQQIYETVVLSVPEKKIHPGVRDGSLKSVILEKLESLKPNSKKFPRSNDPRWNKLKDLLN